MVNAQSVPYTPAMFTLDKLPSGLPILTAPSSGTESVTVLVFAGAGSRYETNDERGISHFLEHMFFKGGKKYRTTQEVSAAIDGVGGDFNAFTGKEYAGYYVKVEAGKIELACDVISDMLVNATFPQEEIEKERGVIMEEERMYQDTPMYRAGWDFEELLYGDCPLGWDTIGTEKVIRSVNTADFQAHKDRLYTADNLVVTFAGKVSREKANALSEQFFGTIGGKKSRNFEQLKGYGKKKVWLRTKNTEQAHLVLGMPGLKSEDPDHFAIKLLSVILGGNMSSRMFLNIREAKGLCYYIATELDNYLDGGSIGTRAGVDQSRLHEAISAIRNEYEVCAAKGVTDAEVRRAKDYLKGKITLSLEDSEERAHFYGKQALMHPTIRTIEQYFAEIEKVSPSQINALAKKVLKTEELRLVVIGKEESEDNLQKLLA
jgi:predicted Zn-dependent peptidase